MSRIVFASACYVGDVAPFIGPANELARQGHDVTFLAPPGFSSILGNESFRHEHYASDFSAKAMNADPVHERLMAHPVRNQMRLARYWMRRGLVDDIDGGRRSFLEAFDGADVVVTHPTFGSGTVPAAHHLGVPVVTGQLFPMMMPTREWGPALPLQSNFGPANGLAWRAFSAASGHLLYDRKLNHYRRSLGIPPRRGNAMLGWTEAERTVVLVSRHYFGAAADDWPGELVGFSPWTGPSGRAADPAVDAFVDDGPPPVLVCLGTSAAAGAGEAFSVIAAGLDDAGLRALLLVANEANLAAVGHRPGAFVFAPVNDVVGRCSVAVVSGALGTLAAALTAGVPVVVVPQLFDQLWHGKRVEALGVGKLALRPSSVAAAVAEIHADPAYSERARELARKIAAEDGASALVAAVRSLL